MTPHQNNTFAAAAACPVARLYSMAAELDEPNLLRVASELTPQSLEGAQEMLVTADLDLEEFLVDFDALKPNEVEQTIRRTQAILERVRKFMSAATGLPG